LLKGIDVTRITEIERVVGIASVTEWARLSLADLQAPVLRVTRMKHDDQHRPLAIEMVVLVLAHFPGLERDGGVIADIGELAQRYGFRLSHIRDRLSVVPTPGDIALHLGTTVGTNVLKRDRVTETIDGMPLEWLVAFNRL
jgi:DNA-binding GntR family transcriptional regulator